MLFLLRGTVFLQHLHVPGIGSTAIHCDIGQLDSPEKLGYRRVLQHREARHLWEEEIPKIAVFGTLAEIFQDGWLWCEYGVLSLRLIFLILSLVQTCGGDYIFLDEVDHIFTNFEEPGAQFFFVRKLVLKKE